MNQQGPEELPIFARIVIAWLAGPRYREHVLGDLQEEMARQHCSSHHRVRMWKEIFGIIPGLLLLRSQELNYRSIGLTLAVTVTAYFLLVLWSLNITRPILVGMRDSFAHGATWDYLYFYMLVRLPGVFLVGAAIAFFTFEPTTDFRRNFVRRLLPLLVILLAPQVWYMLAAGQEEFVAGRIIRAFADGAVLWASAYLGQWLRRRQSDK